MNYRHQADACHAYQIMKKHGIPDERIVVMMYDDLAYNEENPTPGIVINQPNGTDVYHGVPKDYTGIHVTPEIFLKVLQGDKEGVKGVGSGKVIASGPNDHVFVNFADHGAPGILAFPREFLKASALHETIQQMHEGKKYGKMVFYVEACESGSMFDEDLLPKEWNVFATTAANPHESSYACYFDKERKTYLGDVYSVMWMENSDKADLSSETLQKQFEIVKKETNTSHCQEYGNLTIGQMTVAQFQGGAKTVPLRTKFVNPTVDAIPSEDVPLSILEHKVFAAKTLTQRRQAESELSDYIYNRRTVLDLFKHLIAFSVNHNHQDVHRISTVRLPLRKLGCYEYVVDYLHRGCPGMNLPQNDVALRQLYTLVNLCEDRVPAEVITDSIDKVMVGTPYCLEK